MSEDRTILKPLSPYGVTKLASENLGTVYAENFGLPVNSLRFFTVYGLRQRPDMAFNNFIKNGLSDKKIKIFGDGTQSRDFTFISDIVDANLLASKSEISGEIFNVGGGHIVTINHVLKELSNLLNKELDIEYVESQPGDVKHTSADISKAKSKLDYAPKIQITEGLRKEVDYMKNFIDLYFD
jgi:UDP-glucose 4-epimerase